MYAIWLGENAHPVTASFLPSISFPWYHSGTSHRDYINTHALCLCIGDTMHWCISCGDYYHARSLSICSVKQSLACFSTSGALVSVYISFRCRCGFWNITVFNMICVSRCQVHSIHHPHLADFMRAISSRSVQLVKQSLSFDRVWSCKDVSLCFRLFTAAERGRLAWIRLLVIRVRKKTKLKVQAGGHTQLPRIHKESFKKSGYKRKFKVRVM